MQQILQQAHFLEEFGLVEHPPLEFFTFEDGETLTMALVRRHTVDRPGTMIHRGFRGTAPAGELHDHLGARGGGGDRNAVDSRAHGLHEIDDIFLVLRDHRGVEDRGAVEGVHAGMQADVEHEHIGVAGGGVPQAGLAEEPLVVVFVGKVLPVSECGSGITYYVKYHTLINCKYACMCVCIIC